jgi:RNA polymerase sigma factor (sigma-70 family)
VEDPHTVADLVAEVFVTALDSAHTYRAGLGSEVGWLYGVARSSLAVERRRAARELRLTQRIAGRRRLDADDVAGLEARLDAERPARQAITAMAGLPDAERAVLELVAIDQLSVGEAAAALGIRQGTASVRLHRARRALRDAPTSSRPSSWKDSNDVRGELLMELKAAVSERAAREHAREPRKITGRRKMTGAAVVAATAAAVAAMPFVVGSETPAYAMTRNADGSITVQVNDLREPERLEADLARQGVPADVTYLKWGQNCTIPTTAVIRSARRSGRNSASIPSWTPEATA